MRGLALLALAFACARGKAPVAKDDAAKAANDGGTKDAKATDAMSAWMPKDAAQLWQGAHVMRLVHGGPMLAIEVAGDRAKLFDGRDEQEIAFAVIEPCAVAFGAQEIQFLIRDGALVVGRGAAGYKKGEQALVCGDGRDPGAPEEGVYIVDNNRCTTWKRDDTGAWSHRTGVCVWANARGDDLLDVGTEHYSSKLIVHGDYLEEREFTKTATEHRRAESWDAAKSTITANLEPASKLDEAKAAGGVVGDTRTIAGLHATYANHPAPLVGVDLEISGVLVEISTQTIRGQKSTVAVLAEEDNPKSMQLMCEVAGAVKGVAPGDRVVFKGAIDTRHDHARLRRCTVIKAR